MNIRDLQQNARDLSKKHGWDGSLEERFNRLVGEVEELSAEISNDKIINREVAFEIYDIFWNACHLANKLGIDLEPLFAEKQAFNATREWPCGYQFLLG